MIESSASSSAKAEPPRREPAWKSPRAPSRARIRTSLERVLGSPVDSGDTQRYCTGGFSWKSTLSVKDILKVPHALPSRSLLAVSTPWKQEEAPLSLPVSSQHPLWMKLENEEWMRLKGMGCYWQIRQLKSRMYLFRPNCNSMDKMSPIPV